MCPEPGSAPLPASCSSRLTPLPFSSSSNSITSPSDVCQLIYVIRWWSTYPWSTQLGLNDQKKGEKMKNKTHFYLDWQELYSWQLLGNYDCVKTGTGGSFDQWNIWFKCSSVPNCSSFQLGDFNLLCGNNWEAVRELIVFSTDESSGSVGEPHWPHTCTHRCKPIVRTCIVYTLTHALLHTCTLFRRHAHNTNHTPTVKTESHQHSHIYLHRPHTYDTQSDRPHMLMYTHHTL